MRGDICTTTVAARTGVVAGAPVARPQGLHAAALGMPVPEVAEGCLQSALYQTSPARLRSIIGDFGYVHMKYPPLGGQLMPTSAEKAVVTRLDRLLQPEREYTVQISRKDGEPLGIQCNPQSFEILQLSDGPAKRAGVSEIGRLVAIAGTAVSAGVPLESQLEHAGMDFALTVAVPRPVTPRDVLYCLQMLERVPHDAPIAASACRALEQHLRDPDLCRAACARGGAIRACRRAVELHPNNAEVQAHGCAALSILADTMPGTAFSECSELGEDGASGRGKLLAILHDSLEKHAGDASVRPSIIALRDQAMRAEGWESVDDGLWRDRARRTARCNEPAVDWLRACTSSFPIGRAQLWCIEVLTVGVESTLCLGVASETANMRGHPRSGERGRWFFMFCWGSGLWYDGCRVEKLSQPAPKRAQGSRLCVALSAGGRLCFALGGRLIAPPAVLGPDCGPLRFYASFCENGAAVRLVCPRPEEQRLAGIASADDDE